MKKIPKFAELAYIIGIILMSLGTAFIEKSHFGQSMVVAPAYLVSLKVPNLTFGVAEYFTQGFLLIVTCLVVRRFKLSYLFAFVTALLYGTTLDIWMNIIEPIVATDIFVRSGCFAVGFLLVSSGVALMFHSYLSPAVYELFVKEVSKKFNIKISKFKTIFDLCCCVVALAMTFIFFGSLQGIGVGSIFCALLFGTTIGMFGNLFEKFIDFSPRFEKFSKHFN